MNNTKKTNNTKAQEANTKSKTVKLFRKIMPELMAKLEEEARKTDDVIVLHHVDTKMKRRNPKRYSEFRLSDVVPMLRRQHISFHNKGRKHTCRHNTRIAEAMTSKNGARRFKGSCIVITNKHCSIKCASCKMAAQIIGCSRQLVSQVLSENPRYHSYTTAHGWSITLI